MPELGLNSNADLVKLAGILEGICDNRFHLVKVSDLRLIAKGAFELRRIAKGNSKFRRPKNKDLFDDWMSAKKQYREELSASICTKKCDTDGGLVKWLFAYPKKGKTK